MVIVAIEQFEFDQLPLFEPVLQPLELDPILPFVYVPFHPIVVFLDPICGPCSVGEADSHMNN